MITILSFIIWLLMVIILFKVIGLYALVRYEARRIKLEKRKEKNRRNHG